MIEQHQTDHNELWLQYFANGGNAPALEFESLLYGINEASALDLDLLSLTLEEIRSTSNSSQSSG